jgi:molybdopterin/thiamine biosynthesis adenylyltransferase
MENSISQRLDDLALPTTLSDGTPCRTITAVQVQQLADELGLVGRALEVAALKRQILPDRYLRNMKSLSMDEQVRLLESKVCIVGLGGLGGLVTDTLARMGIGRFSLVDGDRFEANNLNRQLLSSVDCLGMVKVEAAHRRVQAINPGIDVSTRAVFLTPQNADELVADSDLVVDCLDNIKSRFTLESAAKRAGIPMISAAVAGISGHVTTIFPQDQGIEGIYGPEKQLQHTKGAELQLGCLAPGVNLIAALECAEVLKVLLQKERPLRNGFLAVDLADYTFEFLKFA